MSGVASRWWHCSECTAAGTQYGRGALRVVCSNACRRARTKRLRVERNLRRAADAKHGARARLHPIEIAEVISTMEGVPRGERTRTLIGLAQDYGVTVRTLHRYLTIAHVEQVTVGDYGCWFALRRRAGTIETVQLTDWERAA